MTLVDRIVSSYVQHYPVNFHPCSRDPLVPGEPRKIWDKRLDNEYSILCEALRYIAKASHLLLLGGEC